MISIYEPYTQMEIIFDDARLQELTASLDDEGARDLKFDATEIDWRSYLLDVHILRSRTMLSSRTKNHANSEKSAAPPRRRPGRLRPAAHGCGQFACRALPLDGAGPSSHRFTDIAGELDGQIAPLHLDRPARPSRLRPILHAPLRRSHRRGDATHACQAGSAVAADAACWSVPSNESTPIGRPATERCW